MAKNNVVDCTPYGIKPTAEVLNESQEHSEDEQRKWLEEMQACGEWGVRQFSAWVLLRISDSARKR